MLGKVIYQYALHLAQQQDTLQLAPLYLCHLRLGLRESLLQTLLAAATDVLDDEQCQALYVQLLAATEEWRQRQQRLQELVLVQGKQPGPWWDVGDEDEEGVEALQLQEGMMGLAGSGAEEQGRLRQPSSCLFGDLRCVGWGLVCCWGGRRRLGFVSGVSLFIEQLVFKEIA